MGFIIDAMLPGFVLEQRRELMFPTPWHIQWNWMWLTQTCVLMAWLIYRQRWVPAWNCPSNWVVKQFSFMLVTHSLFYVVEIYATDIFASYTPMFWHHVLAIVVFSCFFIDNNTLSVVTVIPIIIHGIFWVMGADNLPLLMVYNTILLLAGLITFFNNVAAGPANAPIGNMLGLTAVAISMVNYFTYCRGTVCIRDTFDEHLFGPIPHHIFVSGIGGAILVGAIFAAGLRVRDRWSKENYLPPYARKVMDDYASVEDGLTRSFDAEFDGKTRSRRQSNPFVAHVANFAGTFSAWFKNMSVSAPKMQQRRSKGDEEAGVALTEQQRSKSDSSPTSMVNSSKAE
ncbi:hypothetical protein HDU96_002214 [Phlyctochytrium bullatum]|nr:hypothetical protein HDU96_002214 [Phlyctochytrium bullatum]